jgi:hypothetical protein
MTPDHKVTGSNAAAAFSLTAYRGDGMVMLAMNWRDGEPPDDFVGFAITYKSPQGKKFGPLDNLIRFPDAIDPTPNPDSTDSPFQRFRWVHFPKTFFHDGACSYQVTARHMNAQNKLRDGDTQSVSIVVGGETYPGQLDVTYTRGFMSSQAFVRDFANPDGILPAEGDDPLTFTTTTDPKKKGALPWMGFGARYAILKVLDEAIATPDATVDVVAYDLSQREIVDRLVSLGPRLRIIVDDSIDARDPKKKYPPAKDTGHGVDDSPETAAATRLVASAGADHVVRQHMGKLQHNKTIIVRGATLQRVVCGSTNFSWRGLYVQNNNAIVFRTAEAVAPFAAAFESYFAHQTRFRSQPASVGWSPLGLTGIEAKVTFSPHSASNAVLQQIADDIRTAKKSVFYSLAFLYQTPGSIMDAISAVSNDDKIFVYGISNQRVKGIVLHKDAENPVPVAPASLVKGNTPYPFSVEPTINGGVQMHHKFIVIDADTPDARVYSGSFNFSGSADTSNGENLMLIRDARVASSFMVEALSMFDHYSYRIKFQDAPLPDENGPRPVGLKAPPRAPGETPWWKPFYEPGGKQRDRKLFG